MCVNVQKKIYKDIPQTDNSGSSNEGTGMGGQEGSSVIPAFFSPRRDFLHPLWNITDRGGRIRKHSRLTADQKTSPEAAMTLLRHTRSWKIGGRGHPLCTLSREPPAHFTAELRAWGGSSVQDFWEPRERPLYKSTRASVT